MTPEEVSASRHRVLPLVSDPGNRELLHEWIDDHPSYDRIGAEDGVASASFDVCILDKAAFAEHLDELQARKAATAPVLLPYLLLLPQSESAVIELDGGQLVDNVVTETVDELVTLPIQQAELHWRLAALPRLREQSLTLRTRERELERQIDLFERAQDIAHVGAWEYDIDAGEGWWTDEARRIHGLPEETQASPELSLEYYHPADRPRMEAAFERAIDEGEPYDLELRLVDAEGTQRWVRTRGEPQYEDGELARVRGTIQDITDRKERERELTRIQEAVDASGHAIYITDSDGTIEYVNPAFEETTGFTAAEAVGATPQIFQSGEMSEAYYEELWETVRSGTVWEEEIVNQRKNGETYTAMQTIAPVIDDEIQAFVAVQDDITERKEREETMQRRRKAIDAAPIGICITDPGQPNDPVMYVNQAFVELTGYDRADVLGRNCRFLQGEQTDPGRVSRMRKAIDAREPIAIELRNYRADGTEFWNHLEIAPVRTDDGDLVNYIGFLQDVTGRKERQQHLEVLDRVLRHNLRNDVTVIRGQAETIRSERSGDIVPAAERIMDKSDQLIELSDKERRITELLLETPTHVEVDVGELVEEVARKVGTDYPDASLTVDCPAGVIAEATTHLSKAIRELLTNAIIHDDSTSPDVTVTVTPREETVRIEVRDTGPRIPEMERALFGNGEKQTPLYHGTGLGLWYVTLIASRAGGTITYEENSPAGNVVGVELPR